MLLVSTARIQLKTRIYESMSTVIVSSLLVISSLVFLISVFGLWRTSYAEPLNYRH